jgi:hypothetical protein
MSLATQALSSALPESHTRKRRITDHQTGAGKTRRAFPAVGMTLRNSRIAV